MTAAHQYSSPSALFTDLYQLTMGQAYTAEGMDRPAVFELFFRKMPEQRNFLIAAGLDDVLAFLDDMRFTPEDLAYLERTKLLSRPFLDRLQGLRFTGDVYAVPEGTAIFPNEPLVQVVAPLVEAQLVETYLINQVHFQSLAAAKAARVVAAAAGRSVVEFGARRAHGVDAAIKEARAAYLVGAVGTSNMLAGRLYDIPVFGTMAHSYVQAHDDETEAFVRFSREFPNTTLLVDTYDTLAGVRKVIELCRRLGENFRVHFIRLDSGDLAELARQTRRLLDEAGLTSVRIFASSDLDEYRIDEMARSGAPIDAFGVGTRLATIDDVPHVDMAYKLVEYADIGRMKLSSTRMKATYPGRKQIFRQLDAQGRLQRDILAGHAENLGGTPMLQLVMRSGQRLPPGQVNLAGARSHAQEELRRLPPALAALERADPGYEVEISAHLRAERDRLAQELHGDQQP
jgi:nicotinate phosphoribosyltransferase